MPNLVRHHFYRLSRLPGFVLLSNLLILNLALAPVCLAGGKATVKIGVILPLTGTAAVFGTAVNEGLLLANKNLSPDTQRKYSIELIPEDEKCQPKEAVTAYQALRNQHVNLIIGAGCSSSTLAVAPLAERDKVILFTPLSAAAAISQAGDFIFRNHSSSEAEGKLAAKLASDHFRSMAVLYDDASEAFQGNATAFIKNYHGQTLAIPFHGGAADYRTEALKVKLAAPDAVFIDCFAADLAAILKEFAKIGFKRPILADKTAGMPDFIRTAGELSEGVIYFVARYDQDSNREFWNSFKTKTGREPTIYTAQGFDTLNLLAKAVENCGEESVCVRDYLYHIKDYPGAGGMLSFDANGDARKELAFLQIKQGQSDVLDASVLPQFK